MGISRPVILVIVAIALLQLIQCSFTGNGGENARGGLATAPTEASSAPPSTASQIIDKYVQALGGLEASRSIVSIEAKGTFEMPEANITGSVEFYAKAPNKAGVIIRTPDSTIFTIQAFDGAIGWERSVRQDEGRVALREIKGAELNQMRLDSEFYREYKLKEIYPRLTLKGKEKVDEREAYVIEAAGSGSATETLYFDIQTGLLLRRDMTAVLPDGTTPVEIYFDDYKPLPGSNGVKLCYTKTLLFPENRDGNTIFRFKQVTVNVDLKDSTFSMPTR